MNNSDISNSNNKNIWVRNLDLFKIDRTCPTQHYCVCSEQYKHELDMQVGDILFVKDTIKTKSYRRLGEIMALENKNKIIVRVMGDIGTGSKSNMEKLHNEFKNRDPTIPCWTRCCKCNHKMEWGDWLNICDTCIDLQEEDEVSENENF